MKKVVNHFFGEWLFFVLPRPSEFGRMAESRHFDKFILVRDCFSSNLEPSFHVSQNMGISYFSGGYPPPGTNFEMFLIEKK